MIFVKELCFTLLVAEAINLPIGRCWSYQETFLSVYPLLVQYQYDSSNRYSLENQASVHSKASLYLNFGMNRFLKLLQIALERKQLIALDVDPKKHYLIVVKTPTVAAMAVRRRMLG